MHPAFSVLIFTVTSGFGYGLMIMLILAQIFTGRPIASAPSYLGAFALALALMSIGLLSSTFHLANKKNAWRAFSQFKTSWLSREGVLAILFYPIALSYIALLWQADFESSLLTNAIGMICVALSLILTHCTAMIYASLKTIPQWNSMRVPALYQLFSIYSGLLLYIAVLKVCGENVNSMLVVSGVLLAILAFGLKVEYFAFVGRPEKTSINTATTFTEARVRLFDTGHSAENFLQREFVYEVGPKTKTMARRVCMAMAVVIPAAILIVLLVKPHGGAWIFILAVVLLYFGLLLERWLFFVEAKHVIRKFYGQQ